MQSAISKIQGRGNTTIPQSVRDYLGLERGASIIYTFKEDGKVEIEKVQPQVKADAERAIQMFEQIEKSLKTQGVTFEELMRTGRKERKKLFAEMYPDGL